MEIIVSCSPTRHPFDPLISVISSNTLEDEEKRERLEQHPDPHCPAVDHVGYPSIPLLWLLLFMSWPNLN